MVRPFNGYMTDDGTPFDTEREAFAYEAAYNLHAAIRKQELLANLDKRTQDYVITAAVAFISQNQELFANYVNSKAGPNTIKYQLDLFDATKSNVEEALRTGDTEKLL